MSKRIFRNKFAGVKCSICQQTIAIGAEFSWDRSAKARGEKAMKWHLGCDKDGRLETLNGGFDDGGEDEASAEAKTETVKTSGTSAGSWLEKMAEELMPFMDGKLNATLSNVGDIIEGEIQKRLDGMVLTKITKVVIEDKATGEVRDLGMQHKLFPTLLQLCQVKTRTGKWPNIWLTGPVGAGKTTAAENVAKALNLEFFHFGAMDSEYKLIGFVDAQGNIVNTEFKRWYRDGGTACFDEIDSWLPSATLALNGALANGQASFPEGIIKRHPDAIVIACANTWGFGATTQFVGRMKQDDAFLDRFPFKLDWVYDADLEKAIAANDQWASRVQSLRAKAFGKGLKVVLSPRASEWGAAALECGVDQALVEQVVLKQGMTDDQWRSIQ